MLITLDFETYYDALYTLRKQSTSEYIRDKRFKALSCAIKVDDAPTQVHWGDDIKTALLALDWSQAELLAHHAHFDGLILTHHYGVKPKVYRDTLSMARAVFPKTDRNGLEFVAERLGVANKLPMPDFKGKQLADLTQPERDAIAVYNAADVDSCYQAYQKMLQGFPAGELELIDTTVRMFTEPMIRLDTPRAKVELQREITDKGAAVLGSNAWSVFRPDGPKPREKVLTNEDVLLSNKKFAEALNSLGIVPPTKISKTTQCLTFALAQTDTEFTALERHPDPAVAALVKGRLAAKSTIGETRAARLLVAARRRRRIPVYLNYCGAHTTRWSGGDKLNFQNFPRGGELRLSLLAPPGHVLVVVDSAQIEVRVLAWLAGERWLLDEFSKGDAADPYSVFATQAYGRPIVKGVDKVERQVGKICVLGLGYGMGAFKLQLQLQWASIDLPIEVCEGFVRTYRQSNRNVTALWDEMGEAIGDIAHGQRRSFKCLTWDKERMELPNGLHLHYPGASCSTPAARLNSMGRFRSKTFDGSYLTHKGRSKLYGGLMVENVVQALARVIVADQMRVIAQKYRVVMMSHDEVVYTARVKQAQAALDFGLAAMRVPPSWAQDIPLNAEGGFDVRYSK